MTQHLFAIGGLVWFAAALPAQQSAAAAASATAPEPTVSVPRSVETRIDRIHRLIDLTRSEDIAGLEQTRYPARAARHFERAIAYGSEAIEHSAVGADTEPAVGEQLAVAHREAATMLERALLDDANLAFVGGELHHALVDANRVLAIDADNAAARALRARLELAANQPLFVPNWRYPVLPRLPKAGNTALHRA